MEEEPLLPGSLAPTDGRVPLAYIYQPSPSAMQSAAPGRHSQWVPEFEPWGPQGSGAADGWTATRDPFTVLSATLPRSSERDRIRRAPWLEMRRPASAGTAFRIKSYADNFR
jgi:hypothetical protein